jgi:hypothetical protein
LTSPKRGGGVRGEISEFSKAPARRLLLAARNFDGLRVMITLTYPSEFPADGRIVKDHWKRMRQWLTRNGVSSGLWFLEFQERGAPHFHIFTRDPVDSRGSGEQISYSNACHCQPVKVPASFAS